MGDAIFQPFGISVEGAHFRGVHGAPVDADKPGVGVRIRKPDGAFKCDVPWVVREIEEDYIRSRHPKLAFQQLGVTRKPHGPIRGVKPETAVVLLLPLTEIHPGHAVLPVVLRGRERHRYGIANQEALADPVALSGHADPAHLLGDIAGAVGRIMCRMAGRMQVIAITHLPQIAARALQHLKVYKENETDRTVSRIKELTPAERINEVAVMLSADPPTAAALQTAKELMG